jgi:hypothetical protein
MTQSRKPELPNVKAPCCRMCGRPIVADSLRLSPIRRRIFNLIERHGEIANEVLHAALYGSDPNGGPDRSVIRAHIYHLNKILAPYGLAVRATQGGNVGAVYRMVQTAEAAE